MHPLQDSETLEKFLTIRAAAKRLGLPEWKLRRAIKAGLIPAYALFNSRLLVLVSEILSVIEASRRGGRND